MSLQEEKKSATWTVNQKLLFVPTYHDDSDRETVPEALEADVAVNSRHGFPTALSSCS